MMRSGVLAFGADVSGAEATDGEAPELTEAADLAMERGLEFLIKTQKLTDLGLRMTVNLQLLVLLRIDGLHGEGTFRIWSSR